MDRIPFGVSRLDRITGGGAPPGSVVLLAGEPGAGAREFLYTSAVMNGLGHADSTLFDRYYGELDSNANRPAEIHYVSFTAGQSQISEEMAFVMDEAVVDEGLTHVQFADLSQEYFQLSPVPKEWYAERSKGISELGKRTSRTSVFEALGTYLNEHAMGNLVCIDSVTDLLTSSSDEVSLAEITMIMKGLEKASYRWGGLILLLLNEDTLSSIELGHLTDATDGTIVFRWERGGSERARTMTVRKFRGVLSRLEEEDIVQFETELSKGGFDISDVRKIR